MKNRTKLIGFILVVIFILLQLYPAKKPLVILNNPNDLILTKNIPKIIALKLKTACYDCHSNETVYPWYSNIAPLKWSIYKHIEEGREELNFSDWNTFDTDKKADLLDDISTVVLDKEMPIKGYSIFHPKANLSETDRETIAAWADEMLDTLYE